MTRSRTVFAMLLALGAFILPGTTSPPKARADQATVIRYASLAPSGSAFMKVLKAWNRSLDKETSGRVELRYYSGGSQGDERDFIRKIRAGQMDAAGVSTVGLGMVLRPVLVLSAPGVVVNHEQLERAREALSDKFDAMFRDAGFVLLGWGDAGKNRLFSVDEFARPSDLKSARPWAWKDDPIFLEYLKVIGANPVRVGLPEVYPGLQTRMIDTVPASAITAVALQWYTRLRFMAKQNFGIITGASIVDKEKFDQLSAVDQEALKRTAKRAAKALDQLVHRDDAKAYDSLVKRGLTLVDLDAHGPEWDTVATKTRKALVGRVYSKSLLDAVEAAAREPTN